MNDRTPPIEDRHLPAPAPGPSPSLPGSGAAPGCRRCGTCCRWPGPLRLREDDIHVLAAHLGLCESAFRNDWTELATDRQGLKLVERSDKACVFLEGNRCRVYPARPRQCRDFPHTWSFPGVANECPAARAIAGQAGTVSPGGRP